MILALLVAVTLQAQTKAPQPKGPQPKAPPAAAAPQGPAPKAAPPAPPTSEICMALRPSADPGVAAPVVFPALKLQAMNAGMGLPGLPASDVRAIRCDRPTLTFGSEDYRVITEYGVPLIIGSSPRTAALEIVEGKLRVRMLAGALTEPEVAAIRANISAAEQRVLASPPAAATPAPTASPAARPAAQKTR